jgi:hypothetical protein
MLGAQRSEPARRNSRFWNDERWEVSALPSGALGLISTSIPHADRGALCFKGPSRWPLDPCRNERSITLRGGLNRRTINYGLA